MAKYILVAKKRFNELSIWLTEQVIMMQYLSKWLSMWYVKPSTWAQKLVWVSEECQMYSFMKRKHDKIGPFKRIKALFYTCPTSKRKPLALQHQIYWWHLLQLCVEIPERILDESPQHLDLSLLCLIKPMELPLWQNITNLWKDIDCPYKDI